MAGDNFELAAHAYYYSADSNQTDYVDGYSIAESLLTALSGGGPGVDYGALQMLLRAETTIPSKRSRPA